MKKLRKETLCVQAGYEPKNGEPRIVPIIQGSTFKYDSSEEMGKLFDMEKSGYFYSRIQNPTCDNVAAKICALEGGSAAILTSSGQTATYFSIFNICGCGDHVIVSSMIYGGTYNLFHMTMGRMGVEFSFLDPDCSEEELDAAFKPNTKAVFGESVSNPALVVLDIEKFAKAAHKHGVPLIVDNSFPTPLNCRPFEWGTTNEDFRIEYNKVYEAAAREYIPQKCPYSELVNEIYVNEINKYKTLWPGRCIYFKNDSSDYERFRCRTKPDECIYFKFRT